MWSARYTPAGLPDHAVLSVTAFEAKLEQFILDQYHQEPHSETANHRKRGGKAVAFPRLPESLEQLDLLLLTVAKSRKVHPDGIHFQSLRYLDLTLAAYVASPSSFAMIHVTWPKFVSFMTTAFCVERFAPAGETIALRDIIRARNRRRRDLRQTLQERSRTVEVLLEARRGDGHR